MCVCSLTSMKTASAVLYCHLWPSRNYNIFPHYLINGLIFEKKKSYWTQYVCFEFLYNFCLKHFLFYKKPNEIRSNIDIELHSKYSFSLSNFNETWIFSENFRKIPTLMYRNHQSPHICIYLFIMYLVFVVWVKWAASRWQLR